MDETFYETIYHLVDDYIDININEYIKPSFYKNMISSITELIFIPVEDIIDDEILTYIESIVEPYYESNHVVRSFKTTFKTTDNDNIDEILAYLKNIPQTKQRTDEWYEYRHRHLTASNIWKVFGSQSSYNQLICEKCKPIVMFNKSVNMDSPMHWGQKYEEVSLLWYQENFNVIVEDYGCIPHKDIDCIAASPDGIVTTKNSGRYGRMLEIKNIVNREINGNPKLEYWVQMQFQMEVCNLDECDFLETRFKEYENEKEFLEDGNYNFTEDGKHKGTLISFIDNGMPNYKYPPFGISKEDYEKWESRIMCENEDKEFLARSYWKLDEISCVFVPRHRKWFEFGKDKIVECWNTILKERKEGYDHRLPKKKNKK